MGVHRSVQTQTMSDDPTYKCNNCGEEITKYWGVPYFLKTCDCKSSGYVKYTRKKVLEVIENISEEEKPDQWDELDNNEKLAIANGAELVAR